MNRAQTFPKRWDRWRRVGLLAVGVGLCGGLLLPQRASASAGVLSLEGLRLPAGAVRERLADRMWLHGMPAQVWVFDVPQSPSAVAKTLAAQQPALADLHVLPGQLILSGRIGSDRWVAQLESAGMDRTVGSLSAISVRAAPTAQLPGWLPKGARVKSDVAVMESGVKVSDRIWQYAVPPQKLAELLDAGMRRAGWVQQGDGADQWWARERERMKLWLVPLDGGSGLRALGWAP
ncbi:hypothetical protein [Achromobacter animicus]|uniref:hypothetical protein n=1 Tax=Achromobacter animicus TaxID=1389935 RepID=UPI0014681086|nr:hypothetical protein [Achromobacter animicus]CAB3859799.1 hypothetical protein LMG26689_02428 [Achromobacter animicus]CAB3905839.1 hypothetical protein LMG26691_04730 [Achromobacter animicus]